MHAPTLSDDVFISLVAAGWASLPLAFASGRGDGRRQGAAAGAPGAGRAAGAGNGGGTAEASPILDRRGPSAPGQG